MMRAASPTAANETIPAAPSESWMQHILMRPPFAPFPSIQHGASRLGVSDMHFELRHIEGQGSKLGWPGCGEPVRCSLQKLDFNRRERG
jgi:hypothetical protein